MNSEEEVRLRDDELMNQRLRDIIRAKVSFNPGIGTTALMLHVISEIMPREFNLDQFESILSDLTHEGELIRTLFVTREGMTGFLWFSKGTRIGD